MAGGGGQGNPLGNSLVSIGTRFGGVAPTAPSTGASYTPVQSNPYSPAFSSQQSGAPMTDSPLLAQLKAQQADPLAQFGLRAMLSSALQSEMPQGGLPSLMPAQLMPIQNPAQFRSSALNYRPNIQEVQQNLSRVKPSVYKTDLDNARARIAELEAQQEQANQYNSYNQYSGG